MPIYLFEESEKQNSVISNKNNQTEIQEIIPSTSLINAQEKMKGMSKIASNNSILLDLKKLVKKYNKEKQITYNKAYSDHQEIIAPIISKYQKEYNRLKREICKSPKDANYDPDDFCNQPDIDYPELPVFKYEYQDILDDDFLKTNLSEFSYKTISEKVKISDFENIYELITFFENESSNHQKKIASKIDYSKKVVIIGDMVLPVVSNRGSAPFTFTICSIPNQYECYEFNFSLEVSDNSFSINTFTFNIEYGGTNPRIETETFSGLTPINSIISIPNLLMDLLAPFYTYNDITGIYGQILFDNGRRAIYSTELFALDSCSMPALIRLRPIVVVTDPIETNPIDPLDPNPVGSTPNPDIKLDSFIPKGFGYRQLGIADYKKVVSHVCCYKAGEVAHIENIMASELRSKVTTKTLRSEVTTFEGNETEKENVSDVTSTERFEMQSEIAKITQEDRQLSAYARYSNETSFGNFDAGANYANNNSKEESNRQAVTQAKELTQRAMERIVTRVRSEKTVKITNEFVEENTHVFDNRGVGATNISGVYRYINAVYENQIHNYGKRLMYEFMIPQPSNLHRLGLKVTNANIGLAMLSKPIDPRVLYPTYDKITKITYQDLNIMYGAEVELYPEETKFIGKSFSGAQSGDNEVFSGTFDLPIDKNYVTAGVGVTLNARSDGNGGQNHSLGITVGNWVCFNQSGISFESLYLGEPIGFQFFKYSNSVPISYQFLNYVAFDINIVIRIVLSDAGKEKWQKATFEAIIKGYQTQLAAYNEQEASAKSVGKQMLESNPLFYRQTEQLILKKNAISYLIDNSETSKRKMGQSMYNNGANFENYQVSLNQDMDNYTSFVKFMEQAFDWNIMSYNFYTFYWGNDKDWDDLYQYETNDPLFRNFMQAGMARMVVTVKPGFEDAVMHYMKFGQIWNGGQMPVIGNPLYLSIVDELREQEYDVEETWQTVLPTNLVALQNSGVAVDADGLPCLCDPDRKDAKEITFRINKETLKGLK